MEIVRMVLHYAEKHRNNRKVFSSGEGTLRGSIRITNTWLLREIDRSKYSSICCSNIREQKKNRNEAAVTKRKTKRH